MREERYAVILVPSMSHAVRLEKALTGARIPNKLIPVPRHISSDCGVCARIQAADEERARQVALQAGIEIEEVCPV